MMEREVERGGSPREWGGRWREKERENRGEIFSLPLIKAHQVH